MLVYLGLGSNLGDRIFNIVSALVFLKNELDILENKGCVLLEKSVEFLFRG